MATFLSAKLNPFASAMNASHRKCKMLKRLELNNGRPTTALCFSFMCYALLKYLLKKLH